MKKIIFLLILVVGIFLGYTLYKNMKDTTPKFIYEDILNDIADRSVSVDKFTIYGKYLNIEGILPNVNDNYTIILKNTEEEIVIPTINENSRFLTNQYINDGINLEKLKTGNYLLLLCTNKNEDESRTCYHLNNTTDYHNNTYYTITKNNKNNLISFKESSYKEHNYWEISIKETKLPDDVYDIVIDPGHGGIDTGASNGQYHESKFTLDYAKTLKEVLEEEGLKVKLTHEIDEKIDHYGEHSRTGIPYETKAKLMLSIHLNSSNYKNQHGVEIYRAYETNNNFSKLLADNIVTSANTTYSINPQNKVIDGVYMRVYSSEDLASIKKEAIQNGYEPYTVGNDVTYYYFIRETGGIMTKAFSDGRNPKYKANIYRNYNQGVEAYLCELGYISNSNDLKNIINNKDGYIKALKTSVLSYAEISNN